MLKELLTYISKKLVSTQDAVSIDEKESDGMLYLTIKVKKEEIGMIIGKRGRTIREIRNIMKAAGSKCNKHVVVDVSE